MMSRSRDRREGTLKRKSRNLEKRITMTKSGDSRKSLSKPTTMPETRKLGKSSSSSVSGSPRKREVQQPRKNSGLSKRVLEVSRMSNKTLEVPRVENQGTAKVSKSEDKEAGVNKGSSNTDIVQENRKLGKSSRANTSGHHEIRESNKCPEKPVSEGLSKRVVEESRKSVEKAAAECKGDSRKRDSDERKKLAEKNEKMTKSGEKSSKHVIEESRKLSESTNKPNAYKSGDFHKREVEESRRSSRKEGNENKGDSHKRELDETQKPAERRFKVTRSGEVHGREEERKSECSSKRVIEESCSSPESANKSNSKKANASKSRNMHEDASPKSPEGRQTRLGECRKRENEKQLARQTNLVTRSGEYQRQEDEEATKHSEKQVSPSKSEKSRKRVIEESNKSMLKQKSSKNEDSQNKGEESPKKRRSEGKSVNRPERVEEMKKASKREIIQNESEESEEDVSEKSDLSTKKINSETCDKHEVRPSRQSASVEPVPSTSRDLPRLQFARRSAEYPQERELEQIFGVTDEGGILQFAVKFKRENLIHLIPSTQANREFPMAVIAFYQQHLCWKSEPQMDDEPV